MKPWTRMMAVIAAVVLVSAAVLRADVTVVQTVTIEGAAAAMMGGATPRITLRVKGSKVRTEVEAVGQSTVTLVDMATKEMFSLNPADKTARAIQPVAAAAAAPAAGAAPAPKPAVDVSFTPTGKSQTIDNYPCDEFAVNLSADMGSMAQPGAQMPPEAAEMLKGVTLVITGSAWVAKSGPGIAELTAYQKAALEGNMMDALAAMMGGKNGMDQVMKAAAARGFTYLTDMTVNVQGTGQMVEMMKQMGQMRIITKVASINTDPVPDDMFKVPADYKVIK